MTLPPRILILFSDDSTLIFACRMRALLQATNPSAQIDMGGFTDEDALSERQLLQFLPDRDYITLTTTDLKELCFSETYDAILTSRVYRPLSMILKKTMTANMTNRTKIISFLGGLDFFPEKGLAHRKNCDGVFLFPKAIIPKFRALHSEGDTRPVGFGHPSFLRPNADAGPKGNDIYFFTQAISPNTKRGRLHVLNTVCAIARRNPDRKVWIKLRHLPDENTAHLHKEKYDYPSLLAALPDAPPNVDITACTMDEAMETAGIGITCTSTAAIDLIRMGIPTLVYLDYVDNYCDPLANPMRLLFSGSGVIASLEDVLNLNTTAPNQDWLEGMFCPATLGADVFAMIEELHPTQEAPSDGALAQVHQLVG